VLLFYSFTGFWSQGCDPGMVDLFTRIHPVSYTHLTLPTSDLV